ncbi:Zinc finger RING-type [Arabidopsis thaliana x Arabidopsis arenosa]|uniref:Zinc finger RING-type n=1 Tax=Arabidopsis thaliana x Arabidopsis arenosa TaxID=1240361 RepID=A0A8T2EVR4_9BRAS|nr:Zinc finger RING-type [Arabidopsis thaliana x Arabidopsis arenosa]
MSKRILCKFFAHGACLKGEHCEFSHDWKDPTNNICTYYQRGICSYGSRCRYEHVKASRPHPSASSSSPVPRSSPASASNPLACAFLPGVSERDLSPVPSSCLKPTWNLDSFHQDILDEVNTFNPGTVKPEEQPICSFAAAGDCPRGNECPHIHGNICPTCGKCCLHPFRPEEREEHKKVCEKKQKQLEALKLSQEIECCVCLERVLSKATPAERKFGLLTECDHAFCIACIRNWRSSSPSTGMDVNSTLRACPICRKLSYFVVPSVIWFSAPEEKKEIMDNYREKLRSIDCKHFSFGDGNCPFGTSCFYKHTVKPGSYAWKYHRPPPRRPRPSGTNFSDVDTLVNMIGNIISEGEYGPIGFEDTDDDELTTTDMMMLLMHMDIESEDSSNEDSY